jgi:3-hydroxyisobutyrate dehydrogenase
MRTAVIGTGIMGAGMAGSLLREGHDVVVWNRTRDKAEAVEGATVADTVAEADAGGDVVLTMLYDAASVLDVTDELLGALGPDAVWLQTSTIGPEGAREVGRRAPGRVLDAPVLGTRKPAADGALVVLASGPRELLERARPVLEAVGSRVVDAGEEVGAASALKLACNAWVALLTAGTAQSLGLARALGVEPRLFLEAIGGGAVDTPYAHVKGEAMLGGSDTVSFALDGVRKDLDLMVGAARGADFPDDLLATLLALFDRAADAGHGAEDMAAVKAAFGW